MEHRIKQIMADTFVLDIGEIPDDASFGELEEWDSMGHVHLVGALEDEFGIKFSLAETKGLGTITGIVASVTSKLP